VSDLVVSTWIYSPIPFNEFTTIDNLRYLAQAEQTYANTTPGKRYATIKQLQDAKIPLPTESSGIVQEPAIYDLYLNERIRCGYRFSATVDPDGQKFLIAAVPATYKKNLTPLLVPGASLWIALRSMGQKRSPQIDPSNVGQRSFAIDETGVVRAADLGTTRPVTREEAEKWKPVGAK